MAESTTTTTTTPTTINSITPRTPTIIQIGLICYFSERTVGSGSYSPGLEYDAQLYANQLINQTNSDNNNNNNNNITFSINYISPWHDKKDEQSIADSISKCSIIIGFEEFGTEFHLKCVRNKKLQAKNTKNGNANISLIWLPNLEATVLKEHNKWSYTLNNLDLIDCIIGKVTEDERVTFEKLITDLYQPVIQRNDAVKIPKILCIPHTTHSPPPTDQFPNFYNTNKRKNIIHFAGSSPYKNTLNQIKAGLQLVQKFPQHYSKLIVKISSWPKERYAIQHDIQAIKHLAQQNPQYIELLLGGFISDEEKFKLYAQCRLSLCCSTGEGFGHYLYESLAMGCMIVTTNGFPMRQSHLFSNSDSIDTVDIKSEIQEKHIVGLAEPIETKGFNFGLGYTVTPEAIVDAVSKQLQSSDDHYDKTVIERCVARFHKQQALFKHAFDNVLIPHLLNSVNNINAELSVLDRGVVYFVQDYNKHNNNAHNNANNNSSRNNYSNFKGNNYSSSYNNNNNNNNNNYNNNAQNNNRKNTHYRDSTNYDSNKKHRGNNYNNYNNRDNFRR